jgi:redox-sensing transcriptional repressor
MIVAIAAIVATDHITEVLKQLKDHIVISKATIDRLPLYFRSLCQIQNENVEIISSEELGRRIGVTPEQIRKDLASFGEFGKKGVGYYVADLARHIGEILGLHRDWNITLVGFGHLGWALVNYKHFDNLGFHMKAIFDADPAKVGEPVGDLQVQPIEDLEKTVIEKNIQIAVITVPVAAAQSIADRLVAAGIRGIWNFAPVKLNVPNTVRLCNEDLSVGLASLSYYLSREIP